MTVNQNEQILTPLHTGKLSNPSLGGAKRMNDSKNFRHMCKLKRSLGIMTFLPTCTALKLSGVGLSGVSATCCRLQLSNREFQSGAVVINADAKPDIVCNGFNCFNVNGIVKLTLKARVTFGLGEESVETTSNQ